MRTPTNRSECRQINCAGRLQHNNHHEEKEGSRMESILYSMMESGNGILIGTKEIVSSNSETPAGNTL